MWHGTFVPQGWQVTSWNLKVLLQYVYSSVPLHWEFGCAISEGQMSERRAISWGVVAILPPPAWHVGLFCSKLEFYCLWNIFVLIPYPPKKMWVGFDVSSTGCFCYLQGWAVQGKVRQGTRNHSGATLVSGIFPSAKKRLILIEIDSRKTRRYFSQR